MWAAYNAPMDWVYLDNNATTKPDPEVVAAMHEIQTELWANPSSVHRFGQMARHRMELARAEVAGLIGARDRELVFTSGGTESNNLALSGLLEPSGGALLTTRTEHSAVREPAERLGDLGVRVLYVPVEPDGSVAPEALGASLRELGEECGRGDVPVVVSIQWANNETGIIQPIAQLSALVAQWRRESGRRKVFLHVDGTQAVGKIPVDVKDAGVDLLTLSAHKFHGPKGIGALYVRSGVRLRPRQLGGPQERERRGGTEHTAGIVGFGVAATLAKKFLADAGRISELGRLRDRLEEGILEAFPRTINNAAGAAARPRGRLWNTSNLGFEGLEAEAILLGLSERGVCASAGAACSSGSLDPSPVLLAMGIPEPVAHGSVRFSLSRFTAPGEIEQAIRVVPEVVARLSETMPTAAP
ncbi:MAG TPA: cysteine desulfurase family protein [Candidatus Thermoplasmatota archaeon]